VGRGLAEKAKHAMTRFATLTHSQAWLLLGLFGAILVWGIQAASSAPDWVFGADAIPDRDFFRETVERMRAGEGYYTVQAEINGGTSTFNWRPPVYLWFLAALPEPAIGQWLLAVLALGAAAGAGAVLAADLGKVGQLATIVLSLGGTFAWGMYDPGAFYLAEPWVGPLLMLSLVAYACGSWPLGVTAGLLALMLRELALPYCGIASLLAVRQRRWREVLVWLIGLSGALVLYAAHAAAVAAHRPEAAVAATQWLQPQGIAGLLGSGAMNVFVYPLPAWIRAVALSLALLGLAGWRGEVGTRVALSAAAYVVPLLFVKGWDYWGFVFAPILMLGLVRAPASAKELFRSMIAPRHHTSHTTP
jgi:hypothetical protein